MSIVKLKERKTSLALFLTCPRTRRRRKGKKTEKGGIRTWHDSHAAVESVLDDVLDGLGRVDVREGGPGIGAKSQVREHNRLVGEALQCRQERRDSNKGTPRWPLGTCGRN